MITHWLRRSALALPWAAWFVVCLVSLNRVLAADQPAKPASEGAPKPEEMHRTGKFVLTAPGAPMKLYNELAKDSIWTSEAYVKQAQADRRKWISFDQTHSPATWEVEVPSTYAPDVPHGIFVYISSTDSGKSPGSVTKQLSERRLIAIGPNNAGNDRDVNWRAAAAAHSVALLKERYNIDDDRIYISGGSGGGRVASEVMIRMPELFNGGMPIIGANPYLDIMLPKNQRFPGSWRKPDPKLISHAKSESRFAFLTGEKDFNREQIKGTYEAYQREGFKYLLYLEAPGVGHATPPESFIKQALDFLDKPLADAAKEKFTAAGNREKTKALGEAMSLYAKALVHGHGQPFAEQAKARWDELSKQRQADQAAFDQAVAEKKFPEALKLMTQYTRVWCTPESAEARAMADKMRQARAAK